MGRFKYLIKNVKTSVIEHFGSRKKIIDEQLIIIWSHKSFAYYVFNTVYNLLMFLSLTPQNDLRYSEVIFRERPQRARIDIDSGTNYFYTKIMKGLKELTDDHISVCDMSREDYFSRHIIIDHFYNSMDEAKEHIVIPLINMIGDPNHYIDLNVYHDIQNFRLTGSTKSGPTDPIKKIISIHTTFEQTLIGKYILQ
jgi:hypothetical protein